MNAKKRLDPDRKSNTPFAVLRGEWWEDRKREVAKLNRKQLETALLERDIAVPPVIEAAVEYVPAPPLMRYDRMLWLRLRLVGEEQIDFHTERGEPVPESMRHGLDLMDKTPGFVPNFRTNIFYDVDGEAAAKREETIIKNKIEAIVQEDISK